MKPATVALAAWLWASLALAVPLPEANLFRFRLQDGAAEGLGVSTGALLPRGEFRVGLLAGYENSPLVLLVDGVRTAAAIEHRVTALVDAAWSPLAWVQVSAALPVVVMQSGADLSAYNVSPPWRSGLGSPWLVARLGLWREAEGAGLLGTAPLDVALGLGAALPLGMTRVGATEAGLLVAPELSLGKALGRFRVGGAVGADLRTVQPALSPQGGQVDVVGHELKLAALASAKLGPATVEASARGALPLGSDTPGSVELLVGGRVPVGPVEVMALLGPGLGHLPGTPAFRAVLGVAFPAPAAATSQPAPR